MSTMSIALAEASSVFTTFEAQLGGSGGATGSDTLDYVVDVIFAVIAAFAGITFIWQGAFGKKQGSAGQSIKESIFWVGGGTLIAIVIFMLPQFFGFGGALIGDFFG